MPYFVKMGPPEVKVIRRTVQHQVSRGPGPAPGLGLPGLQQMMTPGVGWGRKVLWFSAVIFCTAVCLVQLKDRFENFHNQPTSVNILITRNDSVIFPSFTICLNITSFTTAITEAFKAMIRDFCQSNDTGCQLPVDEHINTVNFRNYNMTLDKVWHSVRLNETALNVTKKELMPTNWKGKVLNLPVKIDHINTAVGDCLTFHPEDSLTLRGRTSVTFKLDTEAFTPSLNALKNYTATYYYGFHEADLNQVHETVGYVETFPQEKRTTTRISIKKYAYVKKDRAPCREKQKAHEQQLQCINAALNTSTSLPCSLPFKESQTRNPGPPCSTINETAEALQKLFSRYDEEDLSSCYQKIQLCQESIYNFQTLVQEHSEQAGEAVLEVVFLDNVFEAIQESFTYNYIALLSDIGGSLGFYLGISVITLFEAFDQCSLKIKKLLQNQGIN